jgi:hypothetical protein
MHHFLEIGFIALVMIATLFSNLLGAIAKNLIVLLYYKLIKMTGLEFVLLVYYKTEGVRSQFFYLPARLLL